MFAIYFKFKMENQQPKSDEIPSLQRQSELSEDFGPTLRAMEHQYQDQMLDWLIKDQIPPFVVTEHYKIRREQHTPQVESEVECNNIQDKILGYNRKDKSLMELARKFIQKFEGAPSNVLVLDQVTVQLNVERRRIYDIINIMESLSVVSKIKKNVYEWKGLRKAVETIQALSQGTWSEETEKIRKQKSLQSLATEFLKLFSQKKTYLTLEEASRVILNEVNEQMKKTKVRRLYDIVNVFKCLGLVEKLKNSKSFGGKPVYHWLGCKNLIKIIQQRQQNFNSTYYPDQNLNSNSDGNSQKQEQMRDLEYKENLKIEQVQNNEQKLSKPSRTKSTKNPSNLFALKDISNAQQLIQTSNINRRKSVCYEKVPENSLPEFKKQTSFTDARHNKKQKFGKDKGNKPQSHKVDVQQQFQLSEGHSFFFSLMNHLNSSGHESITQIQNKLTQMVWPTVASQNY